MCLAVPGKITELRDGGGIAMATIDYGGITRDACMEYLPEAKVGEYVLVHVGFAISQVDEEEAARTLELLRELGELDDLSPAPAERSEASPQPTPGAAMPAPGPQFRAPGQPGERSEASPRPQAPNPQPPPSAARPEP